MTQNLGVGETLDTHASRTYLAQSYAMTPAFAAEGKGLLLTLRHPVIILDVCRDVESRAIEM